MTDVVQGSVVRRHCSVEEVTAASRRRFSAAASVTRGGREGRWRVTVRLVSRDRDNRSPVNRGDAAVPTGRWTLDSGQWSVDG